MILLKLSITIEIVFMIDIKQVRDRLGTVNQPCVEYCVDSTVNYKVQTFNLNLNHKRRDKY